MVYGQFTNQLISVSAYLHNLNFYSSINLLYLHIERDQKQTMIGQDRLYEILDELNIAFEYHEHPPLNTIEEAIKHKSWMDSRFCKNLFFRNHKGNKHYLVVFDHKEQLSVKDLEQKLKQGKLSFASGWRMDKYLGIKPGSVSPFNLINDEEHHVHVFFDKTLLESDRWSFHPNDNRATLIVAKDDFLRYMEWIGNSYEFIELY